MKLKEKLLILLFVFSWIFSLYNTSFATTKQIETYSPYCILMDSKTGTILYEKNAYEKTYPASTTKLMTAILVVENCKLSDTTTVSVNAVSSIPSGYSTAGLEIGEALTIEQLLNVLLIPSANDAAVVLAEHVAGSVDAFSEMMNNKATEIGCKNTHFVNPNGIHNENHYSTAYDLALITKYAMKYDEIMNIASKTQYALPNDSQNRERIFSTTNTLIKENGKYYYEYATGLKTGYTEPAGYCILSTAEKNGFDLIAVVLGGGKTEDYKCERELDCKTLFEYGFNNYELKTLTEANSLLQTMELSDFIGSKTINILIQDEITVPVNINSENLEPSISINSNLSLPISKGTIVGTITYNIDGIEYTSNLICGENVIGSDYTTIILKVIMALLILFFILKLLSKKKQKKNKRRKNKRLYKHSY